VTSEILIHFEGGIVTNHHMAARDLGRALIHMQNAVDRAHLERKYGRLWKYAKMRQEDYAVASLIALYPEEGGLKQRFSLPGGEILIERVYQALQYAIDRSHRFANQQIVTLADQASNQKNNLHHNNIEVLTYDQMVNSDIAHRRYGDRAINRELNQIVTMIRRRNVHVPLATFQFLDDSQKTVAFDRRSALAFNRAVSTRQLANPVRYVGRVRSLDRDTSKGKVKNLENEKDFVVSFTTDEDFNRMARYLETEEVVTFVGSPITEFGAFDPAAGDVMVLRVE